MPRSRLEDESIERELTWLQRRLDAVRRPTEVNSGPPMDRAAYLLLGELTHGPRSTSSLAAYVHLDPSTIIRQISTLLRRGWVRKSADPAGGRALVIDVTPLGQQQLDEVRADRTARVGTMLSSWSDDDRTDLARLLGQLNASLDARLRAVEDEDS